MPEVEPRFKEPKVMKEKRRSAIQLKTELKRVPFVSRRRKPDIPAKIRKAVHERSGYMCEMKVQDVCTGRATEIDHTQNRSQLGPHTMENLKDSCWACSRWKEANPNAAHELGIYRRGYEKVPDGNESV